MSTKHDVMADMYAFDLDAFAARCEERGKREGMYRAFEVASELLADRALDVNEFVKQFIDRLAEELRGMNLSAEVEP